MKTMLAMALVFGFSALGCGVPVEAGSPEEAQIAQEETLQPESLTNGFCEVYGLIMNGYCSAQMVGTTCPARALSPACVQGTSSTRLYGTCRVRASQGLALSPVPCTF